MDKKILAVQASAATTNRAAAGDGPLLRKGLFQRWKT
jgi:hypothetical protein